MSSRDGVCGGAGPGHRGAATAAWLGVVYWLIASPAPAGPGRSGPKKPAARRDHVLSQAEIDRYLDKKRAGDPSRIPWEKKRQEAENQRAARQRLLERQRIEGAVKRSRQSPPRRTPEELQAALSRLPYGGRISVSFEPEATPEAIDRALAIARELVRDQGFPVGFVAAALEMGRLPYVRNIRAPLARPAPPGSVRMALGREEARQEDWLVDLAPGNAIRGTWYRYGWFHVGVINGAIQCVRADCQAVRRSEGVQPAVENPYFDPGKSYLGQRVHWRARVIARDASDPEKVSVLLGSEYDTLGGGAEWHALLSLGGDLDASFEPRSVITFGGLLEPVMVVWHGIADFVSTPGRAARRIEGWIVTLSVTDARLDRIVAGPSTGLLLGAGRGEGQSSLLASNSSSK
jgi:hypothetical protein